MAELISIGFVLLCEFGLIIYAIIKTQKKDK